MRASASLDSAAVPIGIPSAYTSCQRGVAGLRENKPAAQRAAAEVHIARAENAGFLIQYQIIPVLLLPFVLRSRSLPCLTPMSDTWYHTFSQKSDKKANNSLDIFATGVYNGFAKPVRTAAQPPRALPGHGTDT